MIIGYINYPNNKTNIHRLGECNHIDKHNSLKRRTININSDNVSSVIKQVQNNEISFLSKAEMNDLVVEIDFKNEKFEIAIFEFIVAQLANRYAKFRESKITHCTKCFKGIAFILCIAFCLNIFSVCCLAQAKLKKSEVTKSLNNQLFTCTYIYDKTLFGEEKNTDNTLISINFKNSKAISYSVKNSNTNNGNIEMKLLTVTNQPKLYYEVKYLKTYKDKSDNTIDLYSCNDMTDHYFNVFKFWTLKQPIEKNNSKFNYVFDFSSNKRFDFDPDSEPESSTLFFANESAKTDFAKQKNIVDKKERQKIIQQKLIQLRF